VISITAKAFENVNQWKGISLSPPQQLALAAAASELKPNASIEPVKLLESRRPADNADQEGNRDLWRTTNVLQESLIRGGIKGQSQLMPSTWRNCSLMSAPWW